MTLQHLASTFPKILRALLDQVYTDLDGSPSGQ